MTHDVDPAELMQAMRDGTIDYLLANAASFAADAESSESFASVPERWWLHKRVLSDGRVLYLQQMLGNNTRLSLSRDERDLGFYSNYCYHDRKEAWRAVLGWDGEGDPEGWVRHIETGRRRPDGDPEREYINP